MRAVSDQRPPPGWHPDPWRQAALRWWDGQQWTHHVGAPAPPFAAAGAPAGPVADLQKEADAVRRGRWAAWILAVQLPAFALAMAVFARGLRTLVVDALPNLSTEEPQAGVAFAIGTGLVNGVGALSFIVLVLVLMWFHRAVANGLALGCRGPREPTFATVSFFIPIVNFWWPYESLRDCVPASASELRQTILRWWVLYLLVPVTPMIAGAAAFFSLPVAFGLGVLVLLLALLVARDTMRVMDGVLAAHAELAVT